MSNITTFQKIEYIPALYYRIGDAGVSDAIELANTAESFLNMDAERRALLVLNIEAKSQKLKQYQISPETPYIVELKRYMEVFIGFKFDKYDGFENLLNIQIVAVLKLVGELFPALGRLEIFSAIKYCIKYKPELVKPYDTKDTLSSFTGVYLSQIVRVYMDYKNVASVAIKDLVQQIPEKKNNEKSNLQKIEIYRDTASMVLQNIGNYLHCGNFLYPDNFLDYLNVLYKNMQSVGVLKASNEYKEIWHKWNPEKLANYTQEMKIGFMREVITMEIEKYKELPYTSYSNNVLYLIFQYNDYVGKNSYTNSKRQKIEGVYVCKSLKKIEMPPHGDIVYSAQNEVLGKNTFTYKNGLYGLALQLGFFKEVTESDFDLSVEMELSQIIESCGKKVVSLFPLRKEEFMIREKISGGVGSVMREKFDKIVAV